MLFRFFGQVISRGATGGLSYLQTRGYHSYRSTLIGGFRRPDTKDQAVRNLRDTFTALEHGGVLKPQLNVLETIFGFEFSYNGYIGAEGEMVYDGSQPLPRESYDAVIEEAQTLLRSRPDGIVFSPGSIAILTGETRNGKPVYENRCALITSGTDNEVFQISKSQPHPIDNVSTKVTVDGTGPKVYEIRDLVGDGRSVYLLEAICADYPDAIKDYIEAVKGGKQKVDLIFSPSAGFPGASIVLSEDIDVIVNDAIHNPFSGDINLRLSGVWTPKIEDPFLKKILTKLQEGPWTGIPFITAFESYLIDHPRYREYLAPYRVMSKLPYKIDNWLGIDVLQTEARKLPTTLTNEELSKFALNAVKEEATILSSGATLKEIDGYMEGIQEASKDFPWDYLKGETTSAIDKQVNEALSKITDPLSQSVDNLVKQINLDDVRQAAHDALSDQFQSLLAGQPDVQKDLTEEEYAYLTDQTLTEPFSEKLADATGGESYIESRVRSTILAQRAHLLSEQASELQIKLAQASQDSEETTKEISEKTKAMEDVSDKLKTDPTDPDLLKEKDALQKEIAELTRKEKEIEDEKEKAEKERENNDRSSRENEDKRTEANKREEAMGKDIFRRAA